MSGGEARRERKVVTVLFADLVGFTSRAESLDPEDVEAILRPYHERLRAELERFGGTVEKFIGDAVMALFGAPTAHEDDPERAVRAALAIRDWAREQPELEVRIGITTGEALVFLNARPELGEGMASGDVVNTASRLQAAAPVNGILVDETTFRAARQPIEFVEATPVEAKGKAEPVAVWEAVEARSALEVDVRRPRTPLVGRERELDLLVDALGRVREERSPQLVTLVGEPGIGKSRLIYELFHRIEADPDLIWWRQGRSLPYGEGISLWALGEMVKTQAAILESDAPQIVEEKLEHTLAGMADADWIATHLRPLVGLVSEEELGEDRRSEAFAAWRRFFEELAEERPLVLVFEDLHWADEALLDFVDHLVDWASGVPILVVGSARPELLDRRPGWGGGKRNSTTISLTGLGDEDTARLIGELFERPALPAEIQETLLQRAGGNPLYAEEFVRMLGERGAAQDVPETLQGVIAARLDALPAEEKALLQRAAVVGKVFWLGAVEALDGLARTELDERLHALERKEFVRRERRSAVEGDVAYTFLHVLVRDVAYGQIPRANRAEEHRLAAEWIETLGRPEDHAEMLAHHYLQAFELTEAAGGDATALIEPARRALREAGDRAAGLYAPESAKRFYEAALRLYETTDPERSLLLFRRAAPLPRSWEGGDAALLVEARDALLEAGDQVNAAEADMQLANTFWLQGQRDLANEHSDRAAALIEGAPLSRTTAWIFARRANEAMLAGDYGRALELGSEALDAAEQLEWSELVSEALTVVGTTRVTLGEQSGIDDVARAVEVASRAGALSTLPRAQNNLAVTYQLLGDLETGYALRLEASRVAERLGSEALIRWFQGVLADHRYRRGEWDEAMRMADAFLAGVEAGSPHYLAWQVYSVRALLHLARDDEGAAVRDAERALELARALAAEPQASYFVPAACAYVFVVASEPERALALARDLIEFLGHSVVLQFAVINLPMFASAAVRLGLAPELSDALSGYSPTRWTDAARAYLGGDYVAAAEILHAAGARPDEAEARLRAAEQLVAAGRRLEADEQLEKALAFYRSVGAIRYIREGEALPAATA